MKTNTVCYHYDNQGFFSEEIGGYLEYSKYDADTILLKLIELGYLDPQDVAFVNIIASDKEIKVLNKNNMLLFSIFPNT